MQIINAWKRTEMLNDIGITNAGQPYKLMNGVNIGDNCVS